ncbi:MULTISPECIES: LamG-like jellyroll fold domain-containing protein [unclassified Duganella]|uniref:LamG-like jellyroll fold domain-containing protein n=1 Tax=unclassified Duganella TaxID=2636909 RepID=UPI0009E7E12D|nr:MULTISPECIES: LamG-like jellyroll fold domain-containing protein [unclassified Duganella]
MSKQDQAISLPRRTFCAGSLSLVAVSSFHLTGCGGGSGSGSGEPGASGAAGSSGPQTGQPAQPAVPAPTTAGRTFVHPGLLHTEADFSRMRAKVSAGAQPWLDGWNALLRTGRSNLDTSPRPLQTVIRGGDGSNFGQLFIDVARSYQLALRWKVTGDTAYADKAVEFLNAWSSTLTTVTGNSDRFLAAGIYGYQFANAAEIMRTYSGWAAADFARFQNMMLTVFYPLNHQFLTTHNGSEITNFWANWDLCNLACMLAIGVLCDREDVYGEAVSYYLTGRGNGASSQTVPFIHPGYLGQWQESSRDQGHCTLGIGLAGAFCEMAWNQGDDFYGYDNNRFLAGAEYVAKSNLSDASGVPYYTSMPFDTYINRQGTGTAISPGALPHFRPVWEMINHHYVNRLGLAAPFCAQMAARMRAEGDGGAGDQLGLGTLTFSRDPLASNVAPSGLTARLVGGKVELSWWGTAKASSYTVLRSTAAGGPYTTVASGISGLLTYTDSGMAPNTYYYAITAQTPSGNSEASNEARVVTAVAPHTLLQFSETQGTTAADTSGNARHGMLMNGAQWTAGKQGNAVLLDGVDDYVALPAKLMDGVADFSIAAWVFWDGGRNWARIFDFGSGTTHNMFLTPQAAGAGLRFAISLTNGWGDQALTSAPLPSGQWVHVAVTLSGSTGTLYVNGSAVATNTQMTHAPFRMRSTTQNWIGRSQYSSDPYFNGKIDDFRIYNGALSAAEVAALAT